MQCSTKFLHLLTFSRCHDIETNFMFRRSKFIHKCVAIAFGIWSMANGHSLIRSYIIQYSNAPLQCIIVAHVMLSLLKCWKLLLSSIFIICPCFVNRITIQFTVAFLTPLILFWDEKRQKSRDNCHLSINFHLRNGPVLSKNVESYVECFNNMLMLLKTLECY